MNKIISCGPLILFLLVFGFLVCAAEEFDDLLGDISGDSGSEISGGVTDTAAGSNPAADSDEELIPGLEDLDEETAEDTGSTGAADNDDYLVDIQLEKYFNDDPAEDGVQLNPFESLIKPPKPEKVITTVTRGQEAPKPVKRNLIGVVINGDIKQALIENLDKKESYDMGVGDKTPDFSVVEISEGQISVFDYRMNMRRTITVQE